MQIFPWLFIDDDHEFRKIAEKLNTENAPCKTVGESHEQVKNEIVLGFYLFAVVDLLWVTDEKKTKLGFQHLNLLKQFQPLCECVINSRQIGNDNSATVSPQTINEDLSQILSPFEPLASSFVPKGQTNVIKRAIIQRVQNLGVAEAGKPVEVVFGNDCMFMLNRWALTLLGLLKSGYRTSENGPPLSFEIKDFKESHSKLCGSLLLECDFLVSRICGQGARSQLPPPIKRIKLDLLDGGKSSAMVLIGRPEMEEMQNRASWLVFKIDFRDRIEEEVQSYDRHIKFRVSRHRRVELLGHELGSRLGSICYTFIGVDPTQPQTLRTKFCSLNGKPNEEFRDQIKKLFATPDLHAIKDASFTDITEYFDLRLKNRKPFDFQKKWLEFRSQLESLFTQHDIDHSIIPTDPTNTAVFGTSHEAVWAHGDLHLGNIVVGESDELMLIDFRDTGRAPRVLDFVVLAISVRVESCNFLNLSQILTSTDVPNEESLLKIGLGSPELISRLRSEQNKLSEVGLLLFDLHQAMVGAFRPEEADNEGIATSDFSNFLKEIKNEYVACSFAWACLIFQKLSEEFDRKTHEKSKLKKELDTKSKSAEDSEQINVKIDKVEQEVELTKKQRLAIGLYLCFLGNQMSGRQ
jgi:thiamine kinase-like enzyme